jgi:hypothetical protein
MAKARSVEPVKMDSDALSNRQRQFGPPYLVGMIMLFQRQR